MKKVNVRNLKKAVLATIAAAAMCGASQAHAQLVNFDVPGGVSGATNYSGAAATGTAGDIWNAVSLGGTTGAGVYATGAASTVTLIDSNSGNYGSSGGTGVLALTSPFNNNNTSTNTSLTLSGVADGTYNLFLYNSNGSNNDRGGIFTINGVSLATHGTGQSSAFVAGDNYVEFTGLSVTTGSISITLAPNPITNTTGNGDNYGTNAESDFNGLQLQSVVSVPEPTTWASMLLGLGCLGLVMRQRARKLQS